MSSKIDISHLPPPPGANPELSSNLDISHLPAPPLEMPDTTGQDAILGGLQGLSFGGADEIEGALKAASEASLNNVLESPGTELDRLKNLYRKYQQSSQGEYKAAQERSPYAYTAGEIAGGVAPAILSAGGGALLGGAKVASELPLLGRLGMAGLKGAGAGAAMGGLHSEGALIGATPEQERQLSGDIGEGAVAGGVLGAAAHGLGELAGGGKRVAGEWFSKLPEEKPIYSKMKTGFELGQEGANLANVSGQEISQSLTGRNMESLTRRVVDADKMVGAQLGKTVEDATANGQIISLNSPELQESVSKAIQAYSDVTGLKITGDTQEIFNKILSGVNTTPTDLSNMRKILAERMNKIGGNHPDSNTVFPAIKDIRDNITSIMRKQIPNYDEKLDKFINFRKLVPSTLINEGVGEEFATGRYGDIKELEKVPAIKDAIEKLVKGSHTLGQKSLPSRETIPALRENITKLAENPENTDILDMLHGPEGNFLKDINKTGQLSGVGQNIVASEPFAQTSAFRKLLDTASLGQTTEKGLIINANRLGRFSSWAKNQASKSPINLPANLSREVLNLPNTGLQTIADQLSKSTDPTIKNLADSLLKGLAENNSATKNAILFALMQNKNARASIYNLLPGTTKVENLPNQ